MNEFTKWVVGIFGYGIVMNFFFKLIGKLSDLAEDDPHTETSRDDNFEQGYIDGDALGEWAWTLSDDPDYQDGVIAAVEDKKYEEKWKKKKSKK